MSAMIEKAVDIALELMHNGMDAPLAIHKAADHCALANWVVAKAMTARKTTKQKHTEPPVDAFWMK